MIQKSKRVPQPFLLGILVSWLAGLSACSHERQHTTLPLEAVHEVRLLTVQKAMTADFNEAIGTVRAAQSAELSSQVVGAIVRVNVHEGDRVQRGEVLVTIDAAQQRSAYDSARAGLRASEQSIASTEAEYALAEATMKRYQALFNKKSVSPQEFDEVKTRLAGAKARLEAASASRQQAEAAVSEASTAVGFTRIRAPYDGIVVAKLADAGTLASPGVPILTVEDIARFRLEATVDENQIATVHLGETVPVVIDSLGSQMMTGRVVQIVPMADPASRTLTVKVDLPANPQIRSGMFGRAHFPRGERESMLVPKGALIHRGQLDGLYVVGKDNVAGLRYVTLGELSADRVEVLSGLENGEQIVACPGERELGGRKVGVEPK